MRAWLVVLLIAVAGTARAAPPTIEDARKLAVTEGRALVIEVGASWCGPCRRFERDILPLPAIQSAISSVMFVRYDEDVAPGDMVAQRYKVTAYPTFLIIDPATGDERERLGGVGPDDGKWLVELIERARTNTSRGAVLAADVAARPQSAGVWLALADFERAQGRTDDALDHYRIALTYAGQDRDVIAYANEALERLARAVELRARLPEDKYWAARQPERPSTSQRLIRLAAAFEIPRTELAPLAAEHLARLDPSRWSDVTDAIHAGILCAVSPDAIVAARRWIKVDPDHPEMRFLDAEIALYQGARARAVRQVESVCGTRPPGGFELRCYAFRNALATNQRMPPSVTHALESTTAALSGRAPDRWLDVESLGDLGDFGRALVTQAARSVRACRRSTETVAAVTLDLDVDPSTARLRVLAIHGARERPLEDCLRAELASVTIGSRPYGVRTFYLPVIVAPGDGDGWGDGADEGPPAAPLDGGVLGFARTRAGAVDENGIGARALFDAGDLRPGRVLVGGEVEVAVTSEREASFVAHAQLGVGGTTRHGLLLAAMVGLGGSRHGDRVPTAIDVPLELRVTLSVGRVRLHAWTRGTIVVGQAMRSTQRFGGDETSFGLATSVRLGQWRLFVGGEAVTTALGTIATLQIGAPLGGLW